MEAWTLILLGAAVIFAFLWFYPRSGRCHRGRKFSRENFFAGQDNIVLTWTAPAYGDPSALSYQWTFCQDPAAQCDPNPLNWPAGVQTSSTTSGTITSDLCPNFNSALTAINEGCEFGATLTYAVRAIDSTSGAQSPWAIQTIDLTSSVSGGASSITDPNAGGPLTVASTNFLLTVTGVTVPSGATAEGVVSVFQDEATSGGLYATVPLALAFSGTTGTVSGSFSDSSVWQQSFTPSPFSAGDTVTTTIVVASPTQVYYASTFTTTLAAATVNSPTNLAWTIASA